MNTDHYEPRHKAQAVPLPKWVYPQVAVAILALISGVLAVILPVRAGANDYTYPLQVMISYPWQPETRHATDRFPPSIGATAYNHDNPTVLALDVAAMKYAGMDATVTSWWGQGEHNEQVRFPNLYATGAVQHLGVIPYYEKEGYRDVPVAEIQSDLTYLRAYVTANPGAAVRIGGKPVIWVYNAQGGCERVSKWMSAAAGQWYVVMKVFPGFAGCPVQPSSWHQYGPASPEQAHLPYSYTISPGFWRYDETSSRLPRDLIRWRANVTRMLASGAQWQSVVSLDELGEGTNTFPSSVPEWNSATGWGPLLDELHRQIVDAPSSPTSTSPLPSSPTSTASPSSAPSSSPTPTPSPTFPVPPSPTPSPTSPLPPGPGDITIMAAGDIACQRPCAARDSYTAALFARYHPTAILSLGDSQYEQGSTSQFQAGFATTWGAYLNQLYPAPGNHEWLTGNAQGYRDFFGTRLAQIGSDTFSGNQMYYSYDIGAWHFISFDSDCSQVGGCNAGNPMVQWMLADLAANNGRPTIVYAHHPRWSSGDHGNTGSLSYISTLWVADHDVKLVLAGHDHEYERYLPMGTAGPDPTGLRYFVVGTGGKGTVCGSGSQIPGSQVLNCNTLGVLQLTLHADGSYAWLFHNIAEVGGGGSTFTDAGTQAARL